MLATHISARLPREDGEECFLINPLGLMFDEITASSLIKVSMDGEILQETPYQVNRAGYVIHSAVLAARSDVNCAIHLHSLDGVAVSATEAGLLPLNQTAMTVAAISLSTNSRASPTMRKSASVSAPISATSR